MFEIKNETEVWYKAKGMPNWILYGQAQCINASEENKYEILNFDIQKGEYVRDTTLKEIEFEGRVYPVNKGLFEVEPPKKELDINTLALAKAYGVKVDITPEALTKAFSGIACAAVSEAEFEIGVLYEKDMVVIYNEKKYEVIQRHISQADWTPDVATSLFVEVKEIGEEWKQPTGAHDTYRIGDIVTYGGKQYKSLIDNNAYSPEEYPAGWEEVQI